MRGLPIFAVFFLMFTAASLLIPSPMFPGSVFCVLIGLAASDYSGYLSALLNGVFYGFVLWLAFIVINRRLELEK